LRAAALAGLLAVGWLAWREIRPFAVAPTGFTAVETAVAERDTVALPDGSTAILAPSSQLRAVALNDTVRAFELAGEAYFSVQADADRPFRIRSAGAVTEVLGTEFTVRSREAGAVTVAVREGRVALSSGDGAITLVAGQVGQVADSGAPTLLDSPLDTWLSWLDGVLEFDGDRLDGVTAELSRWFGRRVTLADTMLAGRRVSGRFVTTEPAQALDALSVTLGIPWAERDGAFVLGTVERD
jgi:transmembrane sensor